MTKAMGGDKLTGLKSFTAEGESRRVFGEREMSGGIELAGLLPDAFQVVQVMTRPDGMAGPRVSQTIKGTEAFRDMTGMGGGGGFMMRMGPGGPVAARAVPGAVGSRRPWRGGPGGANRQDPSIGIKAELYRTLLGIMPSSPLLSALTFTHVAEAEAPNGVADVIDVSGPDGFRARLFVDQAEHRPLMLSYMMRQPRMRQMTPPPQFKNDEERRAYFEEHAQEVRGRAAAAPRRGQRVLHRLQEGRWRHAPAQDFPPGRGEGAGGVDHREVQAERADQAGPVPEEGQ